MATLTVSVTTDFSGDVLSNITLIDFTNPPFTFATATFAPSQFGGGQIAANAVISGSVGGNRIQVAGGSLDASAWTFADWNIFSSSLVAEGSSGGDTIAGSSQNDVLRGLGGNDTLTGNGGKDRIQAGGGDDTVVINGPGSSVVGNSYEAGAGTDTLKMSTPGIGVINMTVAQTLTGFERVLFDGSATLQLSDSQLQANAISVIEGNSDANSFAVIGLAIDLSTITFNAWSSNDLVLLNGLVLANNTLVGSSQRDFITGGTANDIMVGNDGDDRLRGMEGADSLGGGGGNDEFLYDSPSHIAAGEVIAGNAGTDRIVVNSGGTYSFNNISITGVERLHFDSFGLIVTLGGHQLGAGGINTIRGSANQDEFRAFGQNVDLTSVSFNQWSLNDDIFIIGGLGTDNVLTGSQFRDKIQGGGKSDIIIGGAGGDALIGGAGIDTADYGGLSADLHVSLQSGNALGGDADGDKLTGIENIIAGSGADSLLGDSKANEIRGGGGDDGISGLGGNDRLIGGAGSDMMKGDTGSDTFIFASTAHSAAGAGRDQILDFTAGVDELDLAAIDAVEGGADNAFSFIGQGAFTAAGQIRVSTTGGGDTLVSVNVNQDLGADMQILMHGTVALAAGDFAL